MLKIRPVGNKILIETDKVKEQTRGGILLPDSVREREQHASVRGTLVAVGDQAWYDYPDPWAQVGDRVIFAKYGGVTETENDVQYRLLNDEDLIAVIEEV